MQTLSEWLRAGSVHLVDVRREGEWKAGHIKGAMWSPLDNLAGALPHLEPDALIAVNCRSGYRSAIACSVLQRAGFRNVTNVIGGYDAWLAAKMPTATEEPVKV